MDEALYTCRFVQLASAMAVFGGAAFRFYALGNGTALPGPMAAFEAWLWRVVLASGLLALVSALALLLCQSAAMAGVPAAALDPETVTALLLETHFGRVWRWRLLIAIVLVMACLGQPRQRQPFVLIVALGFLASLGFVGHATADEGPGRIAHELNQVVHLLAAGLWLGGLLPLARLLRMAREQTDGRPGNFARDALRRFSRMGYMAVALLGVTGAINTALMADGVGSIVGTPYGRLLMVKIMLFGAMVALALINRVRFAPRISRDVAALGALGRAVVLEQVVGLAILAVVAVLGTLPPAVHTGGH